MTPPLDFSAATDLEVVASARLGREGAYRELLHRYQRRVYAVMCHAVGDRELAADLTQETFLKVFQALESHPPERNVAAWIRSVAKNTAADYFRRKEPTPVPLDDQPDVTPTGPVKPWPIQLATQSDSSIPASDRRGVSTALQQAIERLRVKYRRCVELRYLEERSYDDIADILRLPVGTVATYLHRARKQLRRTLGPVLDSALRDSSPPPA